MIPTTISSSPSPTPPPAFTTAVSGYQNNLTSIFTGIAALILEGRAIAEDEFQRYPTSVLPSHNIPPARPSPVIINAGIHDTNLSQPFHTNTVYSVTGGGCAGRQSPKPSTSRAAANLTSSSTAVRNIINITTNPQTFGSQSLSTYDEIIGDVTSETATHERWTQKLCQLRQASPAATTVSRDCGHYDQQVAIEAGETTELVALAINTDTISAEKVGDSEIIRRIMTNRTSLPASGGSAFSPPGTTDNFLQSLQSLATTCLRGNAPAFETGLRYAGPHPVAFGNIDVPRHTMFRSALPPRTPYPLNFDLSSSVSGGGGCCGGGGSGFQSTSQTCEGRSATVTPSLVSGYGACGSPRRDRREEHLLRDSTTCRNAVSCNEKNGATTNTKTAAKNSGVNLSYPQQGPHCEQFLKKMGLARGDAMDAEDHVCDMSYVNITCSRWRAYCLKIEAIIQRGDPVCIEVYLGPERHKILLEQWIMTQKDKAPPPTMTLPSLCSAIRSQLYFSQISAWCDLIKKSDKTIYETERVIFATPTGAAGDLATSSATPGSSPNTSTNSSPSPTLFAAAQHPRLNIFYRIKKYESAACFNSSPNVHNFPNVIVSDGCSISVCLKSLPRINGGIPRLGVTEETATITSANTASVAKLKTTLTTSAYASAAPSLTPGKTSTAGTPTATTTRPTTTATLAAVSRAAIKPIRATSATGDIFQSCRYTLTTIPTAEISAGSSTEICDINKMKAVARTKPTNSYQSQLQKCKYFVSMEDRHRKVPSPSLENKEYKVYNEITATGENINSFNCTLSHREKQLLKYRKRIQKRDKKGGRKGITNNLELRMGNGSFDDQPMDQCDEDDCEEDCEEMDKEKNGDCFDGTQENYNEDSSLKSLQVQNNTSYAPAYHVAMISTGTQTLQTNCGQCGSEKALVCLNCDNSTIAAAAAAVHRPLGCRLNDSMDSMDSCSISSSEIIHTPRNQAEKLLQAIQRTPKAAKKNKKQALRVSAPSTPGGSNTSLSNKSYSRLGCSSHDYEENGEAIAGFYDCKRQKTQHNFDSCNSGDASIAGNVGGGSTNDSNEIACDEDSEESDGKPKIEITVSDDIDNISPSQTVQKGCRIIDKECFLSSTKLTPHIDRCSIYHNNHPRSSSAASSVVGLLPRGLGLRGNNSTTIERSCTPPNESSELDVTDVLLVNCENLFKTPTNSQSQSLSQRLHQRHQQPHKQTPKSTFSASRYHDGAAGDGNQTTNGDIITAASATPALPAPYNQILLRKCLPKINLTHIFCNNPAGEGRGGERVFSSDDFYSNSTESATASNCTPVIIAKSSNLAFNQAASSIGTNSVVSMNPPAIKNNNSNTTIQKSYSAPALPNTPSPLLSPRFSKQAAIYKCRARHLSEHSDRSSLGSDEQFSDEEIEIAGKGGEGMGTSILYSPAISPIKMRSLATTQFRRRPLLGNLEESLLQRRLTPKVEVMGFKILLGASGGFCPTQLTIPAISYFYELHGEALSTPYVCEIRLPRKGYSVPRAGTIQVTLLNPLGTVVRMFVVPYDMRDMPPLHQTFIRQRILADVSVNDGTTGKYRNIDAERSSDEFYKDPKKNEMNGCDEEGDVTEMREENRTTNIEDFDSYNDSGSGNSSLNNHNSNNNTNSNNSSQYESNPLGHFISGDHMKRLRYSIHLRFQTSRSGRLTLHTDIRLLISRRTDCDTAAAHAKGVLEAANDLVTDTIMPMSPKYSARQENSNRI